VYLYTGHDEAAPGQYEYVMRDWRCFSSRDLVRWKEHPVPLRASDFNWCSGRAYASCVVHRNGKFFWYASVGADDGNAIAVAVADSPTGPFRDAKGKAFITKTDLISPEADNFDPSVLIDDDGQAYIFWGKNTCHYSQIDSSMTELKGPVKTLDLPQFMEGVHVYKKQNLYYLAYGFSMPEKVAYAMSRNINGPWKFKGILNELAGNFETNRPGFLSFKGKDYFFYHNGGLQNGGSHRRSVCIDKLHYNEDGTLNRVIMTSEGISQD
jgi:beta-xylosidase